MEGGIGRGATDAWRDACLEVLGGVSCLRGVPWRSYRGVFCLREALDGYKGVKEHIPGHDILGGACSHVDWKSIHFAILPEKYEKGSFFGLILLTFELMGGLGWI